MPTSSSPSRAPHRSTGACRDRRHPSPLTTDDNQTHLPERGKVWHRYVAIGDSFTEGMSDADPERDELLRGLGRPARRAPRRHRARAGGDFAYANLAVRGRLLADVIGPQLDAAIALGPDLVSMVGGGNDILRPKADLDAIAARLEAAVVRLREAGADVLLATPTDPVGRAAAQAPAGSARDPLGQHLQHRPAARRLRHQPVGHEGAAGLPAVGRRPDPHDDRGPPTGRAQRAVGARPRHRPGRLVDAAAARTAAGPTRVGRRQRRVGQDPPRALGAAPAQGRVRPATPCRPSAPSSPPSTPPDLRDSGTRTSYYYPQAMPATRLMPTEEGQDLIDLTREICAQGAAPQVDEAERAAPRRSSRATRSAPLGRAGLLSLPYPEEFGGGGQPYEVYLQVVEEIASVWMSVAVGVWSTPSPATPSPTFGHRRAAGGPAARRCCAATSSAPTACPSATPAPTSPR